jgi:hypothetical protein
LEGAFLIIPAVMDRNRLGEETLILGMGKVDVREGKGYRHKCNDDA